MFAFTQTSARNVGAAGALVLKHSNFILDDGEKTGPTTLCVFC